MERRRRTLQSELASEIAHQGIERFGAAYQIAPVMAMPPRDAFFARTETVEFRRAVGRVSVELVAPYPPGIPVLAPGEEITEGVLDALGKARADGVRVAYAADRTLQTLRVVR